MFWEVDSDEDFKFKGRKSAGGRKLPNRRSTTRSNRLSNDNQRSRLKPSIDDDYEAYEPQHECHICGHVSENVICANLISSREFSINLLLAITCAKLIQNYSPARIPQPLSTSVLVSIMFWTMERLADAPNKLSISFLKCDVCSNGPDASSEDMSVLVKCSGPCKRLTHPCAYSVSIICP